MKSLLEALKEEDRLRILIKEIEKDDEATKDFKSQHLNNIQSFFEGDRNTRRLVFSSWYN